MRVVRAEIIEIFAEAQRLGRRYRGPHLSIESTLVLASKAYAVGPAQVIVPVNPNPERGMFRMKFPGDEKYQRGLPRRLTEIHVAPCLVIRQPCPCGGAWEFREGGRFPMHVGTIGSGAGRRGCRAPDEPASEFA